MWEQEVDGLVDAAVVTAWEAGVRQGGAHTMHDAGSAAEEMREYIRHKALSIARSTGAKAADGGAGDLANVDDAYQECECAVCVRALCVCACAS